MFDPKLEKEIQKEVDAQIELGREERDIKNLEVEITSEGMESL